MFIHLGFLQGFTTPVAGEEHHFNDTFVGSNFDSTESANTDPSYGIEVTLQRYVKPKLVQSSCESGTRLSTVLVRANVSQKKDNVS